MGRAETLHLPNVLLPDLTAHKQKEGKQKMGQSSPGLSQGGHMRCPRSGSGRGTPKSSGKSFWRKRLARPSGFFPGRSPFFGLEG